MQKILSAVALSILASHAAAGTVQSSVMQALAKIPAVENGNVLARMRACHIRILADSWTDAVAADSSEGFRHRKGDVIIWVFIDAPAPSGWPENERDTFKNLNAGWRLRDGKYESLTGWATKIQTKPYPMDWLAC